MHNTTDNKSMASADSFTTLGLIGHGSFSEVYKVRRAEDGKIYALKKIKLPSLKPKQQQYAISEVKILAALSSPYIIGFRQAFYDQEMQVLCVVMEWANQGDLQHDIGKRRQCIQNQIRRKSIKSKQQVLSIRKKYSIPESQLWRAIRDILTGLSLLHGSSILHRDIKTANIFKSSGVYKLGDLNIAKICPGLAYAYTQTGTPYYASPQVWKQLPYNTKSDIWSFGCVIYEMCQLQPPFCEKDMNSLYESVIRGHYKRISQSLYSKQLIQFVESCLKVEARQRKQAAQLLSMPTLQSKLKHYKIQQYKNGDEQDNWHPTTHQNTSICSSSQQNKQISIKITKQLRQYRSITQPSDMIMPLNGINNVGSGQMLTKINKILPCSNYPGEKKKINNNNNNSQCYMQYTKDNIKSMRPVSCKIEKGFDDGEDKSKIQRLVSAKQRIEGGQKQNLFRELPLSESTHEDDKKIIKNIQYHRLIERGINIANSKKSKKYLLMLPLRPKSRINGSCNRNTSNSKNSQQRHQQYKQTVEQKSQLLNTSKTKQKNEERQRQRQRQRQSERNRNVEMGNGKRYDEKQSNVDDDDIVKKYKYKYKYKYQCNENRARPRSQNSRTQAQMQVKLDQKQFHSLAKRSDKQQQNKNKLSGRPLSSKNISNITQIHPQPYSLPTRKNLPAYPVSQYMHRNHQSLNDLPRIRNMLGSRQNNIRQQIGKIYYNYSREADMKYKQKYNGMLYAANNRY